MNRASYTCPCCGYRTFNEFPGSFAICHVCFWEDDPVQLLDPWFSGGANEPSLAEAQANFVSCGAMEARFLQYVKGVLPEDELDPQWRHVRETDRAFVRAPRDLSEQEHSDINAWYYWRHAARVTDVK